MVMVMVMNDLLPPPLCNVNQPTHSEIQLFQNLTMKIHGQGHVCGQRSRSRLTLKIQRSRLWSRSNPLVTFEAWNSINMFVFCFVAIGTFLAEIKQIQYLTLKIKGQGHKDSPTVWCLCAFFAVLSKCYVSFYVKKRKLDNFMCLLEFECAKRLKAHSHAIPEVMAKVKTNGRIWTLEFNRYVCFLFHGNRTIFGWDIANSIFDLENSRSRSWPRSKPMVTFEP